MAKEYKRIALTVAVTLAGAIFVTMASIWSAFANQCEPQKDKAAGLYELVDVMETGSNLILLPDGRFGYQLIYGAYEEWAKGCWKRSGSSIVLNVNEMQANLSVEDGARKFKSLTLKINPKGHLIRSEKGKPWGTYEQVQKY